MKSRNYGAERKGSLPVREGVRNTAISSPAAFSWDFTPVTTVPATILHTARMIVHVGGLGLGAYGDAQDVQRTPQHAPEATSYVSGALGLTGKSSWEVDMGHRGQTLPAFSGRQAGRWQGHLLLAVTHAN